MDKPRYSASIWVVAAQHQLSVSCGLNVLGTLPIISGRQQPDRQATNAKRESAKTNLCLIWDIGLEAIPNQGKRHRELSRKMTYLESN